MELILKKNLKQIETISFKLKLNFDTKSNFYIYLAIATPNL